MLIEDVKSMLNRLATHGWSELFALHGLDILAADIERELQRELPAIDRSVVGFSDFSLSANRAIEPGSVEQSLLYHALASTKVVSNTGMTLTSFPTLVELDTLENYIYAKKQTTLDMLRQEARALQAEKGSPISAELAVVLMTSEYRGAESAIHAVNAGMVFSRTGVSRTGTASPQYISSARGFWPASDSNDIHVIPCTWNPYICTKLLATTEIINDITSFGPITPVIEDVGQAFWVPLHKLFEGSECIVGEDISLTWKSHHVNSKIAKIHQFLQSIGETSSAHLADIDKPPYQFKSGIAELQEGNDMPPGTLVPTPSKKLIDLAKDENGKAVTFRVPQEKPNGSRTIRIFWSSLELRSDSSDRPVPEYVHIRHVVNEDGEIESLNDDPEMLKKIAKGNYEAVHYVDFSGAGFVHAEVSGLSQDLGVKAGFSIVAAPDFYPMVSQLDVLRWHEKQQRESPTIARHIKWGAVPTPLSATRLPADPSLSDGLISPFSVSYTHLTLPTILLV